MRKLKLYLWILMLTVIANIVDKLPQALKGLCADTTTTTLTECIPTIVAAALLEMEEGNIVQPLVLDVPFPGPGVVHNTPFIAKQTAEADDDLASQAMDSTTSLETSPSAATVGVHGAYIQLKDIANLGSIDDMAAIAGQLIGQQLVVRKDLDLVTLFASFSTNQGALVESTFIAPGDLYDAYGSLRGTGFAPLPYNLVLNPLQVWAAKGLISLFDNSADAIQTMGPGTVGEDFARYGFAGMALGFSLYADSNISVAVSNIGSGAAFSRSAIKNVRKRDFQIEIERDASQVATKIVGSEIRGEAILRNLHGNEMQFEYK